jgi:Uma2 family endonuclease
MNLSALVATTDDLMRTEGKAELIAGHIVRFPPLAHLPAVVIGRILRSLADFCDQAGGTVFTRSVGYVVPVLASGRESFCADASYYTGPHPKNPMAFIPSPPDFAVEVRSDWDYGPTAEQEQADKRADYFEAGTRVVWDVDPIAREVRRYRPGEPSPTVFAAGSEADAEPAVPGWRVSIDWLMRSP